MPHVNEPTAPIELERVDVYPYPNFAERLMAQDGSESVPWDTIRIEPRVRFENTADKQAGGASEHFSVRVSVGKAEERNPTPPGEPVDTSRGLFIRKAWDESWSHQNIPPHKPQGGTWEAAQGNNYDLQSHIGLWHVRVALVGNESGNSFEHEILFRVIEAPPAPPRTR